MTAVGCNDVQPKGPVRPPPAPLSTVILEGVPHVFQKKDFCGEACVAMWLGKIGHMGDQDWVYDRSGLPPAEGRGAFSRDLARALDDIGFARGAGWYYVDPERPEELGALFADLHADLLAGIPSIVCMHYSDRPEAPEHFRLILGYDAKTDEVVYHEPAEADGAYRRMARARFMELWPLRYEPKRSTVIRFRLASPNGAAALEPGEPSPPDRFTDADYAQKVMELRAKVPEGFSVAVAAPFVVIGDGGDDEVRYWASRTVTWAVKQLKTHYFSADPDEILEIWLFHDGASYRKWTKKLWGHEPNTPYGYYSENIGALVMNIGTGGGTLVHEIVHPFMAANFPNAPAWLNEGLGSLYEQSSERSGHIIGLTNWRLEGLQTAIMDGRVRSFESLISADEGDFYGARTGINYAQARYLLYYLQEKDLLFNFYRRFRAARDQDPSGFATLKQVLGVTDMAAFQKEWEAWVLKLQFTG